jgi:predicted SAM-dependent methyltransferase
MPKKGDNVASATLSKVYGILARIAITIAAAGFLLLLRPDLANELQHRVQANSIERATPGVIDEYIRTHPVRKLQIGAGGNNKAGWLNSDIEPVSGQAYLDASKPFPLPDRSFQYVYSEQVIEHITFEQGMVMLKESYRVLAPGGRVRLATPDLSKFVGLFQENKTKEMQQYMLGKMNWHQWPVTADPECYILNHQLRDWGHQFVYTPKLLRASLEGAGFKNIRQVGVGESDDPILRNAENRANWSVKDVNAYEAMNFEAVRD